MAPPTAPIRLLVYTAGGTKFVLPVPTPGTMTVAQVAGARPLRGARRAATLPAPRRAR